MAGTLLVGAEEVVLRQDRDSYAASQPIHEGMELISALSNKMAGRFVLTVNTVDLEPAQYWCRMNGLRGAHVMPLSVVDSLVDAEIGQWHQIERQRSQGPLWMVVTAYPLVWEKCQGAYQSSVLFGRRGRLLETPTLRPAWQDLVDGVKHYREATVEELIDATETN